MAAGELVSTGFGLYGRIALASAAVVLVVLLPVELVRVVVTGPIMGLPVTGPSFLPGPTARGGEDLVRDLVRDPQLVRVALATAAFAAVAWLLGQLASAAVVWLAAERGIGRPAVVRDALIAGWRHTWRLVGATLLLTVAALAAVVAIALAAAVVSLISPWLGVPVGIAAALTLVIVLTPVYVLLPSVVVLEAAGPVAALRRVAALLRPRLGPALLVAVATVAVVAVAGAAAGLTVTALAEALDALAAPLGALVLAVGFVLVQAAAVPLVAVVAVLLYVDSRVRHEGFDARFVAPGQPTVQRSTRAGGMTS